VVGAGATCVTGAVVGAGATCVTGAVVGARATCITGAVVGAGATCITGAVVGARATCVTTAVVSTADVGAWEATDVVTKVVVAAIDAFRGSCGVGAILRGGIIALGALSGDTGSSKSLTSVPGTLGVTGTAGLILVTFVAAGDTAVCLARTVAETIPEVVPDVAGCVSAALPDVVAAGVAPASTSAETSSFSPRTTLSDTDDGVNEVGATVGAIDVGFVPGTVAGVTRRCTGAVMLCIPFLNAPNTSFDSLATATSCSGIVARSAGMMMLWMPFLSKLIVLLGPLLPTATCDGLVVLSVDTGGVSPDPRTVPTVTSATAPAVDNANRVRSLPA